MSRLYEKLYIRESESDQVAGGQRICCSAATLAHFNRIMIVDIKMRYPPIRSREA